MPMIIIVNVFHHERDFSNDAPSRLRSPAETHASRFPSEPFHCMFNAAMPPYRRDRSVDHCTVAFFGRRAIISMPRASALFIFP